MLHSEPSSGTLLLAKSPLAAARIFYWRLTEDQRAACVSVVVSAWNEPVLNYFPTYNGSTIAFSPLSGWRPVEQVKAAS